MRLAAERPHNQLCSKADGLHVVFSPFACRGTDGSAAGCQRYLPWDCPLFGRWPDRWQCPPRKPPCMRWKRGTTCASERLYPGPMCVVGASWEQGELCVRAPCSGSQAPEASDFDQCVSKRLTRPGNPSQGQSALKSRVSQWNGAWSSVQVEMVWLTNATKAAIGLCNFARICTMVETTPFFLRMACASSKGASRCPVRPEHPSLLSGLPPDLGTSPCCVAALFMLWSCSLSQC